MTNEELQALLAEWQKTLRLQDWDIQVGFVRHWDLDEDTAGTVKFFSRKKTASISILAEPDYSPSWRFPLDSELTLVHELLHIHAEGCTKSDPPGDALIAEEQMVHALSTALVALKRAR